MPFRGWCRESCAEREGGGGRSRRSLDRAGRQSCDEVALQQQERDDEPARDRAADAHRHAVALRQHDIDQREHRGRRVRRDAADRARRDEARIVVEREDDVGRRRRDRGCEPNLDRDEIILGPRSIIVLIADTRSFKGEK